MIGGIKMDDLNQALLEYIVSESALWDAMDSYNDDTIDSVQLHEVIVWSRDALYHYQYVGEAMSDDQLWVM